MNYVEWINLKVRRLSKGKQELWEGNVGSPRHRVQDGLWLWCLAAQLGFQDGATDILLHTAPSSG